jgi:hypothetical protein
MGTVERPNGRGRFMRKNWLIGAVTVALATSAGSASAQVRECLHSQLETPADRARREQAVALAQEINRAQGVARRFGPLGEKGAYQPLERLFNVPAAPTGFKVQLHTDGATYSFSIKDTLDPCRYAVFSDQSTDVYEAVPSAQKSGLKLLSRR